MRIIRSAGIASIGLIVFFFSGCTSTRVSMSTTPFYDFIGMFENVEREYGYNSFVELQSGDKVYGKTITFAPVIFGKRGNSVKLDKISYDYREVKAVYNGYYFYRPTQYGFAHRIIKGKLNIYVLYGNYGSSVPYFIQRGDEEGLVLLKRSGELRMYLEDCPLALEIFDEGNANIIQSKQQNNHFMATAIYRFNNNCSE